MKIDAITLYHVRMPLVTPFATSFGEMVDRDCILVELKAGGEVGYGECPTSPAPLYSYETNETAWHISRDYLAPKILGQVVPDAEDYRARVDYVRGHPMAKAGIEMALWDVWGKAAGKSLKEMFGGERDAVPVGVSIGIKPSIDELLRVVNKYVDQGYTRVKLKIKPGRDVAEVRAVREAFPDLWLQVDANSAYTLETARAIYPLDELDLLLIEQPLAETDLWDHHKLQAQLETAICLDESITSFDDARHAVEMKAGRIINIKPGRVGGLSQGVAIHDYCQAHGVPVWCGGMLETGVGRASNLAIASLPNFTLPGDISATERYYHQDITNEVFTLNPDSTIDVPNAPGLGITLDHQALAKFTLRKLDLV